MNKIVILDGYTENPGDLSWEGFEKLGQLTVYERTPADKIIERIGDADAVIVNKCPVSRETMDACPNIKYIGVLATGYNIVDVAAAKEKGIIVSNIPTYGTTAVAQFVFALLLEICHHVDAHSNAVKAGDWTNNKDWCFWNYPLIELAGKTMGIIGFGRIGQNTAQIAKALGMNIIAYDEYPNDAGRAIGEYVSLDELFARSDVISLHCPLFSSTQGIINKENIAKMKDGVIIINTSRGPLVVEQDLYDALESGKVYAAGVDVVSTEPIREDNVLRLMDIAVENLAKFYAGEPVNVVNK